MNRQREIVCFLAYAAILSNKLQTMEKKGANHAGPEISENPKESKGTD